MLFVDRALANLLFELSIFLLTTFFMYSHRNTISTTIEISFNISSNERFSVVILLSLFTLAGMGVLLFTVIGFEDVLPIITSNTLNTLT